jgi:hypothetical protein
MLNFGKKIRALRDKKINILTLVLSEKKILNVFMTGIKSVRIISYDFFVCVQRVINYAG